MFCDYFCYILIESILFDVVKIRQQRWVMRFEKIKFRASSIHCAFGAGSVAVIFYAGSNFAVRISAGFTW